MTALVLLPLAHAGEASLTDPAGDQTLLDLGEEAVVRCSDAASDLRGMRAFPRDGDIVLQLDVRDAGSSHVTCRGKSYPTEYLSLSAQIEPAPVCTQLAIGRSCSAPDDGVSVGGWIASDLVETRSCILVHFAEGVTSECLGEATLEGSTYTWSIPLSGTVLVENGDMRSYELMGRSFVPNAYSSSSFTPAPDPLDLQLGLGLAGIADDIYVYGDEAVFTL